MPFKTPAGASTSASRQPAPSTSEFVSPTTTRHVPQVGPQSFGSPSLVCTEENSDDAERRARRRSRVMELQRQQLASPGTPPGERRRSTPLSGLSNTQLADHYASCIKLSTENKINAKNAFGLHLIDYMSELIKKKEMNNFQVASSTLDASAKIYAGRVDAVHSETYKMLGGLGRGADKKGGSKGGQQHEDEFADADEASEMGEKKKKRKRRTGKTVETNLKNITVNSFNLEFEVDPLFQKTSASFDEGGTSGLLLNHLCCLDNSSQLALDSEAVVSGFGVDRRSSIETQKMCSVKGFRGVLQAASAPGVEICPQFSDFTFSNWDKNDETLSSMLNIKRQSLSKDKHAFDIDAEVEPVPAIDQTVGGAGDAGFDDFGGAPDDDDAASEYSETGSVAGESVMMGDSSEARLVSNVMSSIKDGTVGELMQVLSTEPSDYSYFNPSLLSTWAGPSHWKVKGALAKNPMAPGTSDEKTGQKTRKKKAPFKVDFDQPTEITQFFKKTKAATTITKATLKRYTRSSITLPEDVHYPAEKLVKLFAKPKIKIHRSKALTEDVDEGVENYDYDNPNDRENFCPAATEGGDDDDNEGGGFDFTQAGSEYDQSAFQDISEMPDDASGNQTLLGENLIAQPRKVHKIDIAYARTAKKMDVKKLKGAMWSLLTKREEQDKVSGENEADNQQATPEAVNGSHNFSQVISTLPDNVSKNMAKNLSTAICFVCILHLANEKTLKFEGLPDMSDFTITQD